VVSWLQTKGPPSVLPRSTTGRSRDGAQRAIRELDQGTIDSRSQDCRYSHELAEHDPKDRSSEGVQAFAKCCSR